MTIKLVTTQEAPFNKIMVLKNLIKNLNNVGRRLESTLSRAKIVGDLIVSNPTAHELTIRRLKKKIKTSDLKLKKYEDVYQTRLALLKKTELNTLQAVIGSGVEILKEIKRK